MDINEEGLKNKLTPEEYSVLRQKGTEAPFSGKLLHDDRDGMYKCKVCGQDLFSSDSKFDSEQVGQVLTRLCRERLRKYQMTQWVCIE